MHSLDYAVLLFYVLGMLAVGIGLSAKVSNTKDLFAAGGRSPWWASGLSGFMTMFSAGTFVVWGGIAYELGFAAIAINLCYGVAAIAVGWFVAGKWKAIGVRTPAEYIEKRYGVVALHLYTWVMMLYRLVGTSVALYSLAIIFCNLIPVQAGIFQDPETGNLAVEWAILFFGGCIVVYTMVGGLWAVLMTDVLQFIVLNLAVLFMIPLFLGHEALGGIDAFFGDSAPAGFSSPVAGDITWLFLAGWVAIHFFMVGAEWAFAQRFICVPTPKEARKSAWLFGALYLISPALWLLPPLAYRFIHPIPEGATPEEIKVLAEGAYINACREVLPVGMVGLMLAAMFSATASMASSQLNVFAGVLTEDIYKKLVPRTSDGKLLWAGRGFSLVLGVIIIALAVFVPAMGGAKDVVLKVTNLIVTALLAPTVWGLFFKRANSLAVYVTVAVGLTAGILGTYVFPEQTTELLGRNKDTILGVVLPVCVLSLVTMLNPRDSIGWRRIQEMATAERKEEELAPVKADRTPAYIVSGALAACGALLLVITVISEEQKALLATFAGVLVLIAGTIFAFASASAARERRAESE